MVKLAMTYLRGSAGDNILDGGTGTDLISTGNGSDTIILRAGDGANSLADADKIGKWDSRPDGDVWVADFTDGSDVLGLDDGLQYTDLTIAQGTGDYANDTIISITSSADISQF